MYYETSGYQIVQMLMAIASGGLFGVGLGLGAPRVIPVYFTDCIFAVICEQFGILFGVLVLVASIKFLPFASRSGVNSMMQIAPEIEEAAVIFGVPWRTRMTRILFPIQKSSIISGYLLPVISVMREVALFTLLVPYARYLLTTMLFSFNETGYAQYGSAVTLLIILIIILINFVTNKLTGASFDKGIGG